MQISETPTSISDLDLVRRLNAYAEGTATYLSVGQSIGEQARQACRELQTRLIGLERTVGPLLDKVTAKEMDAFTAHDRLHALKVANIMWFIISPERRSVLTPPEIGLLVSCAFLHDLGMFLSNEERETRLAPESDLWERLQIHHEMRQSIDGLRKAIERETVELKRQRLLRRLVQAEEALLAADNRDRHATRDRYNAIVQELRDLHQKDPANIADVDNVFSFQGDSYLAQAIDICVSHNEPPEALVQRDAHDASRPRFPAIILWVPRSSIFISWQPLFVLQTFWTLTANAHQRYFITTFYRAPSIQQIADLRSNGQSIWLFPTGTLNLMRSCFEQGVGTTLCTTELSIFATLLRKKSQQQRLLLVQRTGAGHLLCLRQSRPISMQKGTLTYLTASS